MAETTATRRYETFVLPRSGGHGDLLTAIGLADLLAETVGAASIHLGSGEAAVVVRPDRPLDDSSIDRLVVSPGYPYVKPKANAAVPTGIAQPVDYEREKERVKRYREAQAAARKGKTDAELASVLQDDQPRPDWRQLQVVNMLSALQSWNDLHGAIAQAPPPARASAIGAGVRALAGVRAPAVGKVAGPTWKAGSVQLFNPSAAKGYARLKPDGTSRNDKTKDAWADPFVEWLRCRGYFRAGCPFFVGDDVRLFVPVPADISLAALASMANQMRDAPLWGSGAKLDALAVLWMADYLIHHSRELQADQGEDDFGFGGRTPADVVAGLSVTNYQKMGSARVVSSMTTLALPGWFPIRDAEQARDWVEILDEHRRVVRGLDDTHSDEIGLLLAYRRVLERRGDTAMWALLEFMSAYGPFLIRARDAGRPVRGFRIHTFRRLVESMVETLPVAPILTDPGFAAVAAAVRRATVSAQSLKANNQEHREIRYDLLPELRRAWSVPEDGRFVEVVADFVSKYNYENARRRETGKRAPRNVSTDELAAFMRLVDAREARLVGALLCAYGTCTTTRAAAPAESDDDAGAEAQASDDLDDSTEEGEA